MGELIDIREQYTAVTELKIPGPLSSVPAQVWNHAEHLERLDLSGTRISSFPDTIGQLKKLKIAFFSDCNFMVFPKQLATCPELEIVAFRSNRMREIPEGALPLRLRWLILTNNEIERLPKSIGRCSRLQKCMLSGNRLQSLPQEMSSCQRLSLLRLSANRVEILPPWLLEMPRLAFLSFAGNSCSSAFAQKAAVAPALPLIAWPDLHVQQVLGEGASGVIFRAKWKEVGRTREVAIKLFKGEVTSDGTPLDDMRACIKAGSHANLIDPLGEIQGHPEKKGMVMELIDPSYETLGLPPSLQTCTRDCYPRYPPTLRLTAKQCLRILRGVAAAAAHLHARGITHGDLYAHNILYSTNGSALLGDFGAASIYEAYAVEQLEVLAFAHLMEDMMGVVRKSLPETEAPSMVAEILHGLESLHKVCAAVRVDDRPRFSGIETILEQLWLVTCNPTKDQSS